VDIGSIAAMNMLNASVRMVLAITLMMVIVTLAQRVQVLALDQIVDLFWMNVVDTKNALAHLVLVLLTIAVFAMTKTAVVILKMPLEAILVATLETLEAILEATLVVLDLAVELILAVVLVAHLTAYLLINGNCSMKHAMEMFASMISLPKHLMEPSLSTS